MRDLEKDGRLRGRETRALYPVQTKTIDMLAAMEAEVRARMEASIKKGESEVSEKAIPTTEVRRKAWRKHMRLVSMHTICERINGLPEHRAELWCCGTHAGEQVDRRE